MYGLLEDPITAVNDDDLRHAILIQTCVSISHFVVFQWSGEILEHRK